ncbi:MAG: hypothetical protein AB1847_16535 [bacterium]
MRSRFSLLVLWCFVWVFISTLLFSPGHKVMAESLQGSYSASLWGGYYLPKNSTFQEVYSDDGEFAGFLEFSKTWSSQIVVTLGGGWIHFSGRQVNPNASQIDTDNEKYSADSAKMTLVPGYLQFSYLFRYSQEQKLVPYLGAGLDAWGFQEKMKDGDTVTGAKYGYHGLVGVRLLLDWLDPDAAQSSLQEYGIDNTYLILEARWLRIDDFGGIGLDLSGPLYRVGLLWEF